MAGISLDKNNFIDKAQKVGISSQQANALWNALDQDRALPKLDLTYVLYYFGALVIIAAMLWFVSNTWDSLGGPEITAIALGYIAAFLGLASTLWHKKEFKVPGGLSATVAVCLIPLFVYGVQRWTGWWVYGDPGQYADFMSWIHSGWFVMELSTILGGAIVLYFFPFPFLTVPLALMFWYMAMDVSPLLFGDSPDARMWVSFGYGALLTVIGYILDITGKRDFAFWTYLFGVIALAVGSYVLLDNTPAWKGALFLLINLILMALSILLQRNIFLIAGGIGVMSYLSTLFYRYFADSIFFPIAISIIGLLVILSGIVYHKKREGMNRWLLSRFPESFRRWLP